MSETEKIEQILSQISSRPGVIGVVVTSKDGIPVKSTIPTQDAGTYGLCVGELVRKARIVLSDLTPNEKLRIFRIRSFKNELIIIPDGDFILLIIQDSSMSSQQ